MFTLCSLQTQLLLAPANIITNQSVTALDNNIFLVIVNPFFSSSLKQPQSRRRIKRILIQCISPHVRNVQSNGRPFGPTLFREDSNQFFQIENFCGYLNRNFCVSPYESTLKCIYICWNVYIHLQGIYCTQLYLLFHLTFSSRRHENLKWISNGLGYPFPQNIEY